MASPGAAADGEAESSGVTEQLQARLAQAEAQLASGSDEQTALRSAFEQAVAQRDTLALRYAALKEALGTGDALTVAEADTTPGKGDAQAAPLTLVLLAEHSAVADAALAALRQRLLRDGGLPPDIQGASRAAVEAHGAVRAVVSTLAAIHGDSAELARYRPARRHAGAVSSNDGQLLERCRQLEAQQEAHARQLTEAHAARDAALEQLSGAKARIEACQRAGREMQTVQQSMEADLARCRDALAAQAAELAAFKHAAEAREQEQCALVASLQTRVEATAGVATSELDVLRESVLKLRSQRDEARAAAAALTADVREARTALEQEEQVTAAASVELAAAHARVEALEAKLEDAALQAVTAMEGLQDQLQEAEAGHVEAHAALSDSRARVDGLELQLAEALSSLSTALSAEEASAGARAVLVEKCSVYRSLLFATQVERGDDASVAGDALAQAGAVIDALQGRLETAEQSMSAQLEALEQRLASAQHATASALQRATDAEEQAARLRPALAEVATLQAALSSVEGSLEAQRRELDHCRSELRARDARIRDLMAEARRQPPLPSPPPPPTLWPPDTKALEEDRQAAIAAALAEADARAAGQLAAQRQAASAEAKRLQRLLAAAKAQAQRLDAERAALREAAQGAEAGAAECSRLRGRLEASDANNARLRRIAAELQQRLAAVQASGAGDRDADAAALRKAKADAAGLATSLRRCEGLLRDSLAQRDTALRECASAQASLRDSADATARAARAAASAAARRHRDAGVALLSSLRAVAHRLVSVVGSVAGQASDTLADARALIAELCDGVEASLQRDVPFRGDLLDRLLALCAGFAEEATRPGRRIEQ